MRLIVPIPPVLVLILLPFYLAVWIAWRLAKLTVWFLRRDQIGRLAHSRARGTL